MMKTFKNRWLAGTAALAAVLVLSAPVISAQAPTVSVWLPQDSQFECVGQVLSDGYNALGGMGTLEVVYQPEQETVTRTALAGGSGPDIIYTPGPTPALELARADLLAPLSAYAEQYGWSDRFAPWALNVSSIDGELFALPAELETLLLYYNATVFEENGWTPPRTVDEMVSVAQAAADAGIIPFIQNRRNDWMIGAFFNSMAGPDALREALSGERPWTDEVFVAPLELLSTIQENGWFSGGLDRYYTLEPAERNAIFGSGEAAMLLSGSWQISGVPDVFAESGQEWGWVPVPSTSGDEIFGLGIGSAWAMNAAAANPDAAAEFLDFIFQPETQAALLDQCNLAPGPVGLDVAAMGSLDERAAALFSAFTAAAADGATGYLPWTYLPSQTYEFLREGIELVWDGQMTVEDYLAQLNSIFAEELAAGAVPAA
jgi:raffinose/stachyose/melibiose transport system substrate-binding protein